MLGRIYTVIFISLILFAFWFQKKHLDRMSKEFDAQLNSENITPPISTVKDFVTKSYVNGKLKYTLSGRKIIYFSDGHFEAQGKLVYNEFDKENKNILTLNTEKATGQMETAGSTSFELSNSQLKSIFLPENVYFNIKGNRGRTSQVHFDPVKQTLDSPSAFESNGPQGHLKGTGFHYSIVNEEFMIKSNVSGNVNIKKSLPAK